MKRIAQKIQEPRTLATLRDTHLSKLLSGELRLPAGALAKEGIPATEKFLETHT